MPKRKQKSLILEWAEASMIALLIVLLLKFFCIDLYVISSTSMSSTLLPGDFIIVNKLTYGPRISKPEMPEPQTESDIQNFHIPYIRLPGTGAISYQDVVIFNYPLGNSPSASMTSVYAKRIIGLPGDTVEIRFTDVIVNHHQTANPTGVQFNFRIKALRDTLGQDFFQKLHIYEGGKIAPSGEWQICTTDSIARILKNTKGISSVTAVSNRKNEWNPMVFPCNEHFKWNRDFFGPVKIPSKGDSVRINALNIPLYQRIISKYEKNQLEIKSDSVFINGAYSTWYTFQMNYYFVLGDNRQNADDSRFWGFLPENCIIGKASLILFSLDKSLSNHVINIRWKRCFKFVL